MTMTNVSQKTTVQKTTTTVGSVLLRLDLRSLRTSDPGDATEALSLAGFGIIGSSAV